MPRRSACARLRRRRAPEIHFGIPGPHWSRRSNTWSLSSPADRLPGLWWRCHNLREGVHGKHVLLPEISILSLLVLVPNEGHLKIVALRFPNCKVVVWRIELLEPLCEYINLVDVWSQCNIRCATIQSEAKIQIDLTSRTKKLNK